MQVVNRTQDGSRQVLQSRLWQGADRLDQVVQTAIRCEVAHHRDATFRTIPELVKDSDVLLCRAVALPIRDPSLQDFADLAVADRHLFDAVDFERGPMQHLLYRS